MVIRGKRYSRITNNDLHVEIYINKSCSRDFPGGLVVKTLPSKSWGYRFIPKISCLMVKKTKHKTKAIL